MTILRTDKQVALQDLLNAVIESIDLYRDAANFLDHDGICELLNKIADKRESLVRPLESAIRASGDLPSTPDEDKETGKKWINQVFASLSSDSVNEVLQSRLNSEDELSQVLKQCQKLGLDDACGELLMFFSTEIGWAKCALQSALNR